MNMNSYLCRFLAEHPEGWAKLLWESRGVKTRTEGPYTIFNYGFGCDYTDPLVQEARGIVLDTERLEVVCWPFRKFANHTESYADDIDWSQARVQEKVDGSIVKLWYDPRKPGWQFSTNGTLRAEDARLGEVLYMTYADLIREAENYGDIPFDTLDRSLTYIFELISPRNRVVVPYESTLLYHIGTRSNITGQELSLDIGVRRPREYPIHSLSECIQTAIELNRGVEEGVRAEGFVVVDGHWNRVKVKSPDYLIRHQMHEMHAISRRDCLALLVEEPEKVAMLCDAAPSLIPAVKFYEYQLARLQHTADRLGHMARMLYEEYSQDRGAVAKVIGKHPMAWIAFQCIGNEQPGREFLMRLPAERLCKLVPEYEEEDLSALFEV